MKTASSAVITYLNSFRPTADAVLPMADLYTITLANGTPLTYTDLDIPIVWNGHTYSANSILISGLRYKCSIGTDKDSQQISIAARQSDTIGGIPFMQALQQGIFNAAEIVRERAFFSAYGTAPLGTVVLFKGRVAAIDKIGRTSAQITVESDLTLLDIDMPRNIYQPICNNVFCGPVCGLSAATFTTTGTVASGSTLSQINWSGATSAYTQGTINFTSGANTGEVVTIKSGGGSVLQLVYPLINMPGIGDGFSITQGCDHLPGTCSSKFSNLANFRGFPYVPPPQIITGPLSSTQGLGGK